jgi:putative transposase
MVRKGYTPEQIIGKLREAKVLIEQWRQEYNQVRPHSVLRNKPPAPEVRESNKVPEQ